MKFSELSKEARQEIINDYKQLIEKFTHEKFRKISSKSSNVAIHYYGKHVDNDYSFWITNAYLSFQSKFTEFDICLADIFSIDIYNTFLEIIIKTENGTSMFKILNTQVGK